MVYIFKKFGFPLTLSVLFIILPFFIFFVFYSTYFNISQSTYGAIISLFGTSYLIHSIYVCIWAQVLAFLFFMLSLVYERVGKNKTSFLYILAGIFSHAITSFIFLFYYLIDFDKSKNRKNLIFIGGLALIIWFAFFQNLNLGHFINITNDNGYNPPAPWYTFMVLLNPFLIGSCMNTNNRHWWLFFVAAIFGHNGRFTLFFIPFMVREHIKRLNTNQAWFLSIFCNCLYMVYINLDFFFRTMETNAGF